MIFKINLLLKIIVFATTKEKSVRVLHLPLYFLHQSVIVNPVCSVTLMSSNTSKRKIRSKYIDNNTPNISSISVKNNPTIEGCLSNKEKTTYRTGNHDQINKNHMRNVNGQFFMDTCDEIINSTPDHKKIYGTVPSPKFLIPHNLPLSPRQSLMILYQDKANQKYLDCKKTQANDFQAQVGGSSCQCFTAEEEAFFLNDVDLELFDGKDNFKKEINEHNEERMLVGHDKKVYQIGFKTLEGRDFKRSPALNCFTNENKKNAIISHR